jgi:hypothetical protein
MLFMKKEYYLTISVLLFVICLPLTSVTAFRNSINEVVKYPSFYILISGIISFMFDLPQWLIWLANPLYFLSIYLLKKGNSKSIYVSIISTLLAFSFLTFTGITITGSGRIDKIISLNWGYWIWVLSLSILTIGLVLNKVRI